MNSGGDCKFDCIDTAKQLRIRGVKIGQELQEQLQTGRISDDRMYKYEKRWKDRLAKIDERHTMKNNLTEYEAAKIICRIAKFFEAETPPVCPELRKKVLSCMKENPNQAKKCQEEVNEFSKCVDEALSSVIRKSDPDYLATRKPTYREKFQNSMGRLF